MSWPLAAVMLAGMHRGRFIFSQILDLICRYDFNKCVDRYGGNRRVRSFSCWDQFLVMLFAQFTYRDSLRDIESCLRAFPTQLYHVGIRGSVSRSTLADANENRSWRICLYRFVTAGAFFVIRSKDNLKYRVIESRPVDRARGLRADQTIKLRGPLTRKRYPAPLRRVSYVDRESGEALVFLTNNFTLAASTIAKLYRARWQVELFFKWVKQYLRIKTFFGTSPNAVKTQVWIAVSAYVLVAIAKREFKLEPPMGEILQVLSLTLFEKTPVFQAFSPDRSRTHSDQNHNSLTLFDF